MKNSLIILFVLLSIALYGQSVINGNVTHVGKPISGANISIVDSYDGATTNLNGAFNFTTKEQGDKIIRIEKEGFETYETKIHLPLDSIGILIELSNVIALDAIILNAVVAKSNSINIELMDVLTTAGAMGNIISAVQMLPGTQNNAEDGRLFVRGGDPSETVTYIDCMKVYQAYTSTAPQVPTRGRFSPFLFKGINFSSGGYASRFGNALSGVLNMETIDYPQDNSVDLSLMSIGGSLAFNKILNNKSISANAQYTNLGLYNALLKSKDEWIDSPNGASGEVVFRQKIGKALWKTYLGYDYSQLKLKQKNINALNGEVFGIKNHNLYLNTSVNLDLNRNSKLLLGGSFSKSLIRYCFNDLSQNLETMGMFSRAELVTKMNSSLKWTNGISVDYERVNKDNYNSAKTIDNTLLNAYSGLRWRVQHKIYLTSSLRTSYSSNLEELSILPRVEVAYKFNSKHNMAFIYGKYSQMPLSDFLEKDNRLHFQKSEQILFNYLYKKNKNTLRAEVYYKKYSKLIKYNKEESSSVNQIKSDGFGKASGLDLYWENNKGLIRHYDFWLSYSYIKSERLYQDYPVSAQPSFAPNHTLSWVNKYWVNNWRSQVGVTYKFSSGRPYTNANTNEFLGERTKSYHSVDFSWAYLISAQKILYVGISNVFNIQNEFGYRYSNRADADGKFNSEPIKAQTNQFFFVGFFWTFSTDKSKNFLKNL